MPSPTNHSTYHTPVWLQNFVSHSSYLDILRTPTRFSHKQVYGINVKALIGDGITLDISLIRVCIRYEM